MKNENKPKKKVNTKKNSRKCSKTNKKNLEKRRKVIFFVIIIIAILGIVLGVLFSSLFNIKNIIVINNSRVTAEEIIQNSGLIINENMFKTPEIAIRNSLKKNPYIESIEVKKKLNGEVIIDVKERIPTYMLAYEENFAYINNQGYILEVSANPLQVPIIKGYATQEIVAGKRLDIKDLEKLDTVIQITEAAKSKKIKELITSIDISNKNNYILEISTENKTIQFGNETNINEKILWIIDILGKTKDVEGEIVLNDSDIKKAYFRQKV